MQGESDIDGTIRTRQTYVACRFSHQHDQFGEGD